MTRLTKLSMFDESSLNDEIDEIEELPNETTVKFRDAAENTAFRNRTHDPKASDHHSAPFAVDLVADVRGGNFRDRRQRADVDGLACLRRLVSALGRKPGQRAKRKSREIARGFHPVSAAGYITNAPTFSARKFSIAATVIGRAK